MIWIVIHHILLCMILVDHDHHLVIHPPGEKLRICLPICRKAASPVPRSNSRAFSPAMGGFHGGLQWEYHLAIKTWRAGKWTIYYHVLLIFLARNLHS